MSGVTSTLELLLTVGGGLAKAAGIRDCARRRRNVVGVPARRRGRVGGGCRGWEEDKVGVRVGEADGCIGCWHRTPG